MNTFKHLDINDILRSHSQEVLTIHTIEKINQEIRQKEEIWLNQRDD